MGLVVFLYITYFGFVLVSFISAANLFRMSPNFRMQRTFVAYCDELFSERLPFYRQLDAQKQMLFMYRVHEFIRTREWKGFHGFEIDSEHRAIVAACAVQLTFGLKEYKLDHIKRIFIAPDIFYSRLVETDVKGLTTPLAIYFSWDDISKGLDTEDDAYNLCLHEFAHALKMSVEMEDASVDSKFLMSLDNWEEMSDNVYNDMRNYPSNHFLRNYAATNKHEFFAVCVENFFERSKEFADKEPRLYKSLCRLLNINPLNGDNNFELDEQFAEAETNKPVLNYDNPMSSFIIVIITVLGFLLTINFERFSTDFGLFLFATFATGVLYKVTHRDRKYYTGAYIMKVFGLFAFGLLPVIYAIMSLMTES